jgi:hypothetical protein
VQGWDKLAERTADQALRGAERTDWECLRADTLLAHAEVMRLVDRHEDAASSLQKALRVAEAKGYAVAAARARGGLEELAGLTTRAT